MALKSKIRLETVRIVLADYLDQNEQRKTPERFAILEEIYANDEHMDVDTLHFRMRLNNYRISKATIYNNLDMLIASGLVRKHQFEKGKAQYEKCFFRRQHDHVILTDTGEIIEFCDPRIETIKKTIEKILDITIASHSLYFYGTQKMKTPTQTDMD